MEQPIDLRQAERRAFATTYSDGLWDLLVGCFVSLFAIAPLLSSRLGDFWSSAVFLPFWGLVWLAIVLLRRHLVAPRIGTVRVGKARRMRLRRLGLAMVAVNTAALILGVIAATRMGALAGAAVPITAGLVFLALFSAAAWVLGINRLYLYGLLTGGAPLVGEWLWRNAGASHHGYPITFGVAAGVMILAGLVLFVRLLRDNPVPVESTREEVG